MKTRKLTTKEMSKLSGGYGSGVDDGRWVWHPIYERWYWIKVTRSNY